jgi:hypothetical protein
MIAPADDRPGAGRGDGIAVGGDTTSNLVLVIACSDL